MQGAQENATAAPDDSAENAASPAFVVEARALAKSYGSLKALDEVNFVEARLGPRIVDGAASDAAAVADRRRQHGLLLFGLAKSIRLAPVIVHKQRGVADSQLIVREVLLA